MEKSKTNYDTVKLLLPAMTGIDEKEDKKIKDKVPHLEFECFTDLIGKSIIFNYSISLSFLVFYYIKQFTKLILFIF